MTITFDLRVQLELLVTEREAMVAENRHQLERGKKQTYGPASFFYVANEMKRLADALPKSRRAS